MDKMHIIEAVKEWHRYAEMDLFTANHMIDIYPTPFEIITYHCQQCAEKYLKSYLVYNDQDVVKTHNLVELCNLCASFEEDYLTIKRQCQILTRYASATRYPSKLDLTDHDVKIALEYAREVKEFVLKIIKGE